MKFLFLHLSDLHIRDNSQVTMKVDKIVHVVQSVGKVDKCVLICSGDLTYSGAENEYKCVKKFMGTLLSKLGQINDEFIETYLVPGNHDISFPKNPRGSSEILEYYEKHSEHDEFMNELKWQAWFFEYAKSKRCFMNCQFLDSRLVNWNGFNVQFNLINTAPFSTLSKDNKELHYLPDSCYYTLCRKENVDLSVTIMHHSTEWFHYKTKNFLEKVLRQNSDIVFQGHEHNVRGVQSDGFILSKGGEFSGEFSHRSTFSILIFDTEKLICNETEYEWNDELVMFCKKRDSQQFAVPAKSGELIPSHEFLSSFYKDPQNLSESVLDYFVFPKLFRNNRKHRHHEDIKLITEELFWSELTERKIISITGKSGNGKTTLLKFLYNQCVQKKMIPLYLGNESYRLKASAEKILKNLFEEQYSNNQLLFEKYEQAELCKKVLLIDDLDLIKYKGNQEKLIEDLKSKVGFIVYTSQNILELDVTSAAIEEILESETYYNITIEDFYKEKRTELVSRICALKSQGNSALLPYIKEIIDHLVDRRHGLFELSPANIVQYVKFFLTNGTDDRKGEAVFNVVFETNLRNAIIEKCGEKYLEYCLLSLEEIAYYMHQNKNERITYSDIVNLINNINTKRGLQIDIKKCLDTVLSAKIIRNFKENNIYEFSNRNYLAYFIAKKLNNLIEKNGIGIPELQYIFNNICFGINDNILLFLSFLRNNTAFALNLCEMLDSLLKEYPELNFDQNNIRFIKYQSDTSILIPTQNDQKEIEKVSDDIERLKRQKEFEEIQYRSVYDYNEEDANKFQNKIVRAVKYLEVISKSLISHYVNLELPEKQRIIDLMYSAPNRILFAIFKPYDDKYGDVIDELKRIVDSTEEKIKLSKKEIEEIFNDSAVAICLSLYDNVAFYGTNSETLKLLNEYPKDNSNYKVANLIMEEVGGTSENFVDKAIKLNEDEDDVFIKNLIQRIARKHIITKNVGYKIRDRIADKILTASSKDQLYLMSISKGKKKE